MDDHKKNVTIGTMVLLNLINFGIVGFWSFDGAVMLPFLQTRFGIENDVGGLIVGIGKFMIFLSMFYGVFSDKTQTRMGKRRPLMLLGGLICAPLIALIPHMPTVWSLVVVLTIIYFFMQFSSVPYFSLVPEVVPNEKLGTANAFFSAFGGIGTLIAYAVLFSIVYTTNKFLAFHILGAIHLVCTLITVFSVKEYIPEKLPPKEDKFKAIVMSVAEVARDIPKYKDLMIFLCSNLFFWLGLGIFVQFFTKFMEFYANVKAFHAGLLLGAIVIVSVILAVPVGIIGDKISRKMMTFAGMFIMFIGLIAGYFLIGPNSKVSGLDLSDFKVVETMAAKQGIDMSAADLSVFTKEAFAKPQDLNKDEMSDKKSDAMRWCLTAELENGECDKAVALVMGKDNAKLGGTVAALKKLNKFVVSETTKVLKVGMGVIAIAAIGMTICVVIMATILPTLMPESKMGLYMGFYSTITGLGQLISVVLGGFFIQMTLDRGITALGYRWMFLQGAFCMLIASIAVLSVPYIPKADEPTITDLEKQAEELARQIEKAQQGGGKGGKKQTGGARKPQQGKKKKKK
jgi:Na+/melibiose symporter-like transporter